MNHDIVESFTYLVRERGIDKDILLNSVEDIFGMMVKKNMVTIRNMKLL